MLLWLRWREAGLQSWGQARCTRCWVSRLPLLLRLQLLRLCRGWLRREACAHGRGRRGRGRCVC